MKTIWLVLKTPFYKHAAGTVLELAEQTDVSGWDPDERVRERQDFHDKRTYRVPDGGRGFAVDLSANDVVICPEKVFEDTDLRTGTCRVTKVFTWNRDESRASELPPCGTLTEENVLPQSNAAIKSQGFLINLPPFEAVAEKMVLQDTLRHETVLEYPLRNYTLTDTQLRWDVSDLRPGFYDLEIRFPDNWVHTLRFIKSFPFLVDANKIPAAPAKEWPHFVDSLLNLFRVPEPEEAEPETKSAALPNEALSLCLEWGAAFNQPTQERMMQRHPDLSRNQADELDRLAREVRSYVYGLCEQELEGKIAESDLHFATKRQYPWVNGANFNRMKNVGMYYARR